METSIPNLQLEIEKLEIDIASLRSSVEKKASELQSISNELHQTDGDEERRGKLEVSYWKNSGFPFHHRHYNY